MRKFCLVKLFFIIQLCFLILATFSCSSIKNITYFQDIPDSGKLKNIPVFAYLEPKIQVDDILTIIITVVDPTATSSINLGNLANSGSNSSSASSTTSSQPAINGYLVNKSGEVELPILGNIKVTGLTTTEATQLIKTQASKFYNNPSVIVRYANFKITVTGEVTHPSIYVMPNEKVTILDALAIAGDLTIYGKRNNVLLLRDNGDGEKTAYRIDLTKSDLINQPYYYLKQNDFIYVEPTKGKAAANDLAQTRDIAILSSLITVIVVIISRINF